MSDLINVLFCGDSLNLYSGFSYVIVSLMKAFYKTGKFNISYVNLLSKDNDLKNACKIHGDELKDILYNENENKIKLYNAQLVDERNYQNFDKIIQIEKPQLVISLVDPWQVEQIAYSHYRNTFYWVSYNTIEIPEYPPVVMFPSFIDGTLRKSLKVLMNKADLVIPVTEMGRNNFEILNIKCTEPILCGVDFNKRCTDKLTKQEVFGMSVKNDSFIFATLGTNTERKRLDLSIESFYLFLNKINNPEKYFLYIHTNPNETSIGTDLIGQGVSLGILNKLMFPHANSNNMILSQNELFKRLSVIDCYVGLPSGEGFGYGLIDSMMHGVPVIYVNYGGHVEYCKDVGLPVDVQSFYNSKNAYMKWAIADVDQASNQMVRIAEDNELRKDLGKKGIEVAKNLSWENQSKKFIDLVLDNFNITNRKSNIHSKFYLKRII